MFKIKARASFFWPIEVRTPADGGVYEKGTFDAEFKLLPQDQLTDIANRSTSGEVNFIDLAREVVIGWKGVQADDGSELPFSAAGLDQLLARPGVPRAIATTFFDAFAKAVEKN